MRVAVISDLHSNLVAFEAVIADFGSVDQVWCLGDVVGYGPQPNECVERLRGFDHACVAGNHDWAALDKISIAEFNPDAQAATRWTSSQLTPSSRAYLENLPLRIEREGFTLVHGSPRDPIWEYVINARQAAACLGYLRTRYCFVGHSHLPMLFTENNQSVAVEEPDCSTAVDLASARMIINPGGVGQPRDGNPDASYLLLDTSALRVEYRRVAYDVMSTQARMQVAGLPTRLYQRLIYGL